MANAIRLHDQVVVLIARLFRSLRLEATVEPICLFAELSANAENQRPDILIRHQRGFGRSIILDVAITGIDGQSRPTEESPDRHLQVRYDQKIAKCLAIRPGAWREGEGYRAASCSQVYQLR